MMDKSAKELNRFGKILLNHLYESRREFLNELRTAGKLNAFLQDRQGRAANQYENLMKNGAQTLEAEEVVMRELLQPPLK